MSLVYYFFGDTVYVYLDTEKSGIIIDLVTLHVYGSRLRLHLFIGLYFTHLTVE